MRLSAVLNNRLHRQKVVGITHRQDYYNAYLFTVILHDEHSDAAQEMARSYALLHTLVLETLDLLRRDGFV